MNRLNARRNVAKVFVVGLALAAAVIPMRPAAAINLGDILKVGGWVYIMRNHADELDDGINAVVGRRNLRSTAWVTKVVPIVSVGQGGFIGAVQVAGPRSRIAQTKAALQLESRMLNSSVRARIFVPIDSTNPANRIRRVEGVGITTLLDLRL